MYARILQFLRSKTHLIEIYFRKIYFPTIRVPAIHSIHFMRNSLFKRNSSIFWTIAKCRSQSATSNYPEFSSFFIRNHPRVKTTTKIKSPHRLHLNVKKKLAWLLTDIMVEKRLIVTNDQKSCKRLLICGSQCICSSVFGLFCIYHFHFPEEFRLNCSFPMVSEILGLPSRVSYIFPSKS